MLNLMGEPSQGLGEDGILCPRTWESKAVLRLGFELGLKAKTTVVLRWGGPSSSQTGGSGQLAAGTESLLWNARYVRENSHNTVYPGPGCQAV